ncbi:MAG: hypothetical protein CMJ84_12115 [Planctomycetes bacterium]|nr:hypothetical protein [Planctomycetota bacterium]
MNRVALVLTFLSAPLLAQPLTVFILAGQSNMQGHAKVETFAYIGDDPKTAPLLARMQRADGTPTVCDDVWISYLTAGRGVGDGEGKGRLTAGYGARRRPDEDGGKIGPEFTFGLTMAEAIDGPVLLIKTAWGGKSLHTDFRPPSAGPYVFKENQLARFAKRKTDVEKAKADKVAATGRYYRLMIDHVKGVLSDIKRVYPAYDQKAGHTLAGFAWFQGWNDMVDRGTYPNRDQPGGYDAYGKCMAAFIRDVRKDLQAPDLPFVIGVMGVGGLIKPEDTKKRSVHRNFREAMAAPASMPEFKGTVRAVQTARFWDAPLAAIDAKNGKVKQMVRFLRNKHKKHANADGKMTPREQKAYVAKYRTEILGDDEKTWKRGASNAGYHYLGCGKTMALIGEAFANAIIEMRNRRR